MRTPAKSFLQVSLFRRGEFIGSELFSQNSIIVGVGPDADLQLQDAGVRRQHAAIHHEDGKTTIRTLSSTHPTLVNDRSIRSCEIDARDKIVIGSFELRVALVSPRLRSTAAIVDDGPDPEPEPETVVVSRVLVSTVVPSTLEAIDENEPVDEDEEDLEEEQRPGYSLLERLLADESTPSTDSERVALEIIGWIDERIQTTVLLTGARDSYALTALDPFGDRFSGVRLAVLDGPGEATLEIPQEIEPRILRRGKSVPSGELTDVRMIKKQGRVVRRLRLSKATAIVVAGNAGFCLRFVAPRMVPKEERRAKIDPPIRRAFGSAIAVHVLVGALVGLGSSGFVYEERKEMWAELEQSDLRNVEIEMPPPAEEPQPAEPEAEAKVEEAEPPPEKVRPPKRRRSAAKKEEVKSKGILGALGKMSVQAPGKKSLVAAASNLNAVSAPGGGGFRVGALISKAPASGISVGGGGGGKLLTRGTASLIRDGNLVAGIAKRSGSVRGRVTKASGRLLKTKGSISREEVARVINDHIREVQYCYEKTLISNAGLQGKLVLEWSIDQSGSVSRVRQKMSTLQGSGVFDCISASLKRWRFPKPQGGIVIVSYPFIFNSVGF